MLSSIQVRPTRGAQAIVQYVRIRDRILIDAALATKLQTIGADFNIVLVAREVEHAPGVDLKIPSGVITIVATRYNGHGRAIDVSGDAGDEGVRGLNGTRGYVEHPMTRVPGGPGNPGHLGAAGHAGGSIRLLCEQLGEVTLRANGGKGGKGGAGGKGGDGGKGVKQDQHHDGFEGSVGGVGGAAGHGGAGGKGGAIAVEFTAAGVPPPMTLETAGGVPGAAGDRGVGGISGEMVLEREGARGAAGKPGAPGAVGSQETEPLGVTKFRSQVRSVLGSATMADWVAYRLAVGVYRYRQYKPKDTLRQGQLSVASSEFDAVLRLVPDHAEAIRYNSQIEQAQNVLGYAANFDLFPDFDTYIADYREKVNFVQPFYMSGIALMLAASAEDTDIKRLKEASSALNGRYVVVSKDLDAADAGSKAAAQVAGHAAERLKDLNAQIAVAAAKTPDEPITFGAIASTVGLVAAAVGSVAGSVVTGGASLAALAPAIAGLAVQLSDVGNEIFAATQADIADVQAKYQAVGKDFGQAMDVVQGGTTATVNFVDSIKRLSIGKSVNTEVVGLMHQGVELAYEILVANLQSNQAKLTLAARTAELDVTKKQADLTQALIDGAKAGETILRISGLSAVHAAQKTIDTMLTSAFQAERAVEIYTFADATGAVSYDAGYVHPDLEAEFAEAGADAAASPTDPLVTSALKLALNTLVGAYSDSWRQFLDPIGLQQQFDDYFADPQTPFVDSQLVRTVTDTASLDAFRASQQIQVLIDRGDLVVDEFETKIVDVNVALVGATVTNPGLSCDVFHGGVYLSRRRNGAEVVQPLTQQRQRVLPRLHAFDQDNPPIFVGPIKGSLIKTTKNLWGRGVAGTWEVTIPEGAMAQHGVDLSGLTAIQLWISTQSFVGAH